MTVAFASTWHGSYYSLLIVIVSISFNGWAWNYIYFSDRAQPTCRAGKEKIVIITLKESLNVLLVPQSRPLLYFLIPDIRSSVEVLPHWKVHFRINCSCVPNLSACVTLLKECPIMHRGTLCWKVHIPIIFKNKQKVLDASSSFSVEEPKTMYMTRYIGCDRPLSRCTFEFQMPPNPI